MDTQAYATIIKSVCARLGDVEPDNTIIRNITQYCKKLDIKQLRKTYQNENDMLLAIVEAYLDSISKSDEFDYSEHLHKQASGKTKQIEQQPETRLTNWLTDRMPVITSKAMNLYVDSRLRRSYGNESSLIDFGFTLVPRTTKTTLGDGNLQARVMPSQITYFKMGKVVLPYKIDMRGANFTNEMTLTFTALRSNGIMGSEDTYHFIFTYVVKNDYLVELTPVNEFCKFSPPLRYVDNISFRMSDPIVPVQFAKDRMYASSLNYQSSDGRITFAYPHGLANGDVVIINGFSTGDNAANANIISQINSPRGLVISVINPTMISIGIDFSTVVSPDTTVKPLVIFYSKTFRFQLEIGYQDITEI
jgi:hypothetical protein